MLNYEQGFSVEEKSLRTLRMLMNGKSCLIPLLKPTQEGYYLQVKMASV